MPRVYSVAPNQPFARALSLALPAAVVNDEAALRAAPNFLFQHGVDDLPDRSFQIAVLVLPNRISSFQGFGVCLAHALRARTCPQDEATHVIVPMTQPQLAQ
jgi:hypothetical protein